MRGGIFILRSDIIPGETRLALLVAARAVLLSRHGSLAEQTRPPGAGPSRDAAAGPHGAIARGVNRQLPDVSDARIFQWPGWILGRRRRVRDDTCATVSARPHPGSMSSPIPGLASRYRPMAAAVPGPATAAKTGSRPGPTIRSTTARAKCCTFATTTPAGSSARRHCRSATRLETYVARHGRGYSRFEHTRYGIALDLLQFVPVDESIKVSRLRIRNLSGRTRHLTLTSYVEWVLGTSRSATAPYVATEMDTVTGAMLARNLRSGADAAVAFTDLGGRQTSLTGNRMEFIGRNGTLAKTRGARQGRGALRPHRRRSGPLRCTADVLCAGREFLHRTRVVAGRGAHDPRRAGHDRALARRGSSTRHCSPSARSGATCSAPSRCRRRTARSTSC